jgi:translation initiation factor IF-1
MMIRQTRGGERDHPVWILSEDMVTVITRELAMEDRGDYDRQQEGEDL